MRLTNPHEQLLGEIEELLTPDATPAQVEELSRLSREVEWARIVEDPWYFLTHLCRTKDEHAREGESPYRPFPPLDYIRHLVYGLRDDKKVLIEKSRQMLMSWIAVGMGLWLSMTHQAQRGAIQSKKEPDANSMLLRMYGLWERLPGWLKLRCPAEIKYCELRFPRQDSSVHALAEGETQARSSTFSWFFADEMAFQAEVTETLAAVLPTLGEAGRLWGVSTPYPGVFLEMAHGPVEAGTHRLLVDSWFPRKGLTSWRTQSGFRVFQLHHSADPAKDDAWAAREALKYPGGRQGRLWKREYDLDAEAAFGRKVFPEFSRATHVVRIAPEALEDLPLFRVIDPGFNNPCCVLFFQVDGDGVLYCVDEIYESGLKVPQLAQLIKARTGRRKVEFTLIGLDAFRETQVVGQTMAKQLAEEGVYVSPVDVRVDPGLHAVGKLLLVNDAGQPGLVILERCEKTIWEFERYRFPDVPEGQVGLKAESEKPIKVDDHAMDCVRYMAMALPQRYRQRLAERAAVPEVARSQEARRRHRKKVLGQDADNEADDEDLWDG